MKQKLAETYKTAVEANSASRNKPGKLRNYNNIKIYYFHKYPDGITSKFYFLVLEVHGKGKEYWFAAQQKWVFMFTGRFSCLMKTLESGRGWTSTWKFTRRPCSSHQKNSKQLEDS